MALGVQRCRERELLTAIAEKAVEMRALQKAYFKNRRQTDLRLARKSEIELDALLERLQGFEFMQARRRGVSIKQAAFEGMQLRMGN